MAFTRLEHDRPLQDRLNGADDVTGFGDQRRALLDQIIGAGGARIERRARHRKHLTALFGRHPRRDQRARAVRGLDHDDAERCARYQAVAAWKVAGARHVAERHFGNRAAAFEQRRQQILMLRRIDPVVAACQHRDGAAFDRRAMRGLIDTACQPGDDDEAGIAEIARQLAGEFQPGAGSVARADDRNHRPRRHIGRAAHAEQGRRIVERCQPRRIGGFAGRDQRDADPFRRGDFGPCFLLAADAARSGRSRRAAPGRAAAPAPPAHRRNG